MLTTSFSGGTVMGEAYSIKCSSCDYGLWVTEGIGMMYSPNAVFYGRCDDPSQNWSIAFPDGYCKNDKPLLLSLVKSKTIKEKAFELLTNGAHPDNDYGHELFVCPKCMRLSNRFHFKLISPSENFEPDYKCSKCRVSLNRVIAKQGKNGCYKLTQRNKQRVDWKCPDCGGDQLISGVDYILWD